MRAKAAVARAKGAPLAIVDLEVDEPRDGEVLVRLVASGVAACDRAAVDGTLAVPLPFVPGCEGAGIVERVGAGVERPAPGEAVLITREVPRGGRLAGLRPDGSAPYQADGSPVHGFFFGQSSFASHLLCQARLAVPVADDAPLELLAALGHEVMLGAGLVLQRFGALEGATVVITGADAVGLAASMAAKAAGAAMIIVADPREARRELALATGATIAVPADDGLAAVVKGLVADGADLAIETSGAPAALAGCEASLRAGGRCLVAADCDPSELDLRDLTARLVALHAEGRFPVERLVSYYPFEHVNDALAALASDAVAKPVLRFALGGFGELDRALQEGAAREEPADGSGGEPSDAPSDLERATPPVTA